MNEIERLRLEKDIGGRLEELLIKEQKLEAIRVLVKKWDENKIDAVEFLLQTSIIVEALGDE